MGKALVELFRALRSNDLQKARKAYERGADINWPLDKWIVGRRQHWGLRVHAKPFGLYLGFSIREAWKVPDGEGADRGDTLMMVALKCRMQDAVIFLLGCDRYNPNCFNEAGNSAHDIARATGQEFLMRGRGAPPAVGMAGGGLGGFTPEALPPDGVSGYGGGPGAGGTQYAQVVVEAVPIDPTLQGGGGGGGGGPMYATAEPLDGPAYSRTGQASAPPVIVPTPVQTTNHPVGPAGRQYNPYDPTDGGGRASVRHGPYGTGVYGAF